MSAYSRCHSGDVGRSTSARAAEIDVPVASIHAGTREAAMPKPKPDGAHSDRATAAQGANLPAATSLRLS